MDTISTPESTESTESTGNIWFSRVPTPRGFLLTMEMSDEHPGGEIVDLPARGPHQEMGHADVLVLEDGKVRVSSIGSTHPRYGGAPEVWYLVVNDTRNGVPALVLAAFMDSRLPAGTVASPSEAAAVGASLAQRAGSLRWLPGSGAVHQVETAPEHRRKMVGSRLLAVAALMARAHGWPVLSGGDERTAAGNDWLESLPPSAIERVYPWERTPELEDLPSRLS